MTHGATLNRHFGRAAGTCAALAFALILPVPVPASARAPRQAQAAAPDEDLERGVRLLAQGDAEGAAEALRARMRELAERLEAFATTRPNDPEAGEWGEHAGTLRHYGRMPAEGEVADPVLRRNQTTKKAVITFKPEPGYPAEAREQGIEGVVRLRAVLMSDGRVRHIIALRRLPGGLTERSVAAARKIRFEPATVDGSPVAQYVVLEYKFEIY